MANPNVLPSEQTALLATIDPDANAAATYTSDWVDASEFEALLGIVLVGTIDATGTVDAKFQQATDSSGTGAKDISPAKAITQLTAAGTDSDKQALLNIRQEELDHDNAFTFVALLITVATAAADAAGVIMGHYPRYGPASDNDLASVDEIVN